MTPFCPSCKVVKKISLIYLGKYAVIHTCKACRNTYLPYYMGKTVVLISPSKVVAL